MARESGTSSQDRLIFLIDVNLSATWVEYLNRNGIASIHWSSVGHGGAPDTKIMSFAIDNSYAILTNDLDFGAILVATHMARPTVLQLRLRESREEIVGSIVVAAILQNFGAMSKGALLTIDPKRTRVRLLPIL